MIPPIKGLDSVDYLTNENALELTQRPDSLLIIGGGYVAVEFAHFFAAMGTKVTIVEMLSRIAQSEEPEISELLEKEMKKRMDIYTNTQVEEIRRVRLVLLLPQKIRSPAKEENFPPRES